MNYYLKFNITCIDKTIGLDFADLDNLRLFIKDEKNSEILGDVYLNSEHINKIKRTLDLIQKYRDEDK